MKRSFLSLLGLGGGREGTLGLAAGVGGKESLGLAGGGGGGPWALLVVVVEERGPWSLRGLLVVEEKGP